MYITETSRQLCRKHNQVILTDWSYFNRVREFVIVGVAVVIGRNKFLGRFEPVITQKSVGEITFPNNVLEWNAFFQKIHKSLCMIPLKKEKVDAIGLCFNVGSFRMRLILQY